MSRDENPLSRWSRRKLAAKDTPADPVPKPAEAAVPGDDAELPEEDLLEKLGLPDPDTLQEGDDFAARSNRPFEQITRNRVTQIRIPGRALCTLDAYSDTLEGLPGRFNPCPAPRKQSNSAPRRSDSQH